MAVPALVPTSLSLTTERTDSHFICIMPCCISGDFNPNVIVTTQGGFREEDDGGCSKVGKLFKNLCCCCKKKDEESEPEPAPETRNRETREAVQQRVENSLTICLAGEPQPRQKQAKEEAEQILSSVDPEWTKHTQEGAPLSSSDFRSIQEIKRQRTKEKVVSTASSLQSEEGASSQIGKGIQATPVRSLLPGLIVFVQDRSGKPHLEKKRLSEVKTRLNGYGYYFSDVYVNMIIENIQHINLKAGIDPNTVNFFESIFQVAAQATKH